MTIRQSDEVVRQIGEARARKATAHRKANARPTAQPDKGDDPRPWVVYSPHELHVAVANAIDVLSRTPNVYERGGQIVRVAGGESTHDEAAPALERHAQDDRAVALLRREARVVPFTVATLRAFLTGCLRVGKRVLDNETGEWVMTPMSPPDEIVKAITEAGAWPAIPPLEGLSETAFLRPDGTVATSPGYDRSTGYVLAPGADFLDVPKAPTREDAVSALAELEEVFADFPHVSRPHRMVPVAAILTLLARPAIVGNVPAFLFDASTRGSGKSLQSDAVALIATGHTSSKMGWPPDPAELEKVLGAYALRGAVLVNFDNVLSGFGGAALDRCLTAGDRVELRVLGRSEVPKLPWRAVVVASGNNLAILGDTTRRVLVSRIESPLENPEDRTEFRHPELLPWVRENRARLVRAALTVLRGFVVAGRPSQGLRTWGSFEAWAALIPQAIVWAGGEDVMACRAEVSGAMEPEKAALLAVLELWPRLAGDSGTTAKRAVEALYPAERARGGPMPPDGFEVLRDALESVTNAKPGLPPSPVSVGKFLQRVCGRVVGGRRIARRTDRTGLASWRVENSENCAHPLTVEP